jgi:hypothetical protein
VTGTVADRPRLGNDPRKLPNDFAMNEKRGSSCSDGIAFVGKRRVRANTSADDHDDPASQPEQFVRSAAAERSSRIPSYAGYVAWFESDDTYRQIRGKLDVNLQRMVTTRPAEG